MHYLLRERPCELPVEERSGISVVALENNVVHDAHSRHKTHAESVLRNEAHAYPATEYRPGGKPEYLFAAEFHGAAVRLHKSGDYLAQLLLTASRDTCNAEYLAAVEVEAHIPEQVDALERLLGQPVDGQHGLFAELLLRAFYLKGYRAAYHHFGKLLRGGVLRDCGGD